MKRLIIMISAVVAVAASASGQKAKISASMIKDVDKTIYIYEAVIANEQNRSFLFQINNDNTVNFVYDCNICSYSEYEGKITQINDTLFHVVALETFGVAYMMALIGQDTISFKADTDIFVDFSKTRIVYSNGVSEKFSDYINHDTVRIPINKRLFNAKHDSYKIVFCRKNQITGAELVFKVWYGSDIYFSKCDDEIEFDVIIKDKKLCILNLVSLQYDRNNINNSIGSDGTLCARYKEKR